MLCFIHWYNQYKASVPLNPAGSIYGMNLSLQLTIITRVISFETIIEQTEIRMIHRRRKIYAFRVD